MFYHYIAAEAEDIAGAFEDFSASPGDSPLNSSVHMFSFRFSIVLSIALVFKFVLA